MSVPAMREQIKTILLGVTGIGVVHYYNRRATDWNKILERFKDADGKINTVMFARDKMQKRLTGGSPERAHLWRIRVIMGLKDDAATGITFDALLTAIEAAFENYDDLNGTCLTTKSLDWGPLAGQEGIQIETIDERVFGSVLCHYAELLLCAIEYES